MMTMQQAYRNSGCGRPTSILPASSFRRLKEIRTGFSTMRLSTARNGRETARWTDLCGHGATWIFLSRCRQFVRFRRLLLLPLGLLLASWHHSRILPAAPTVASEGGCLAYATQV